MQAASARTRNVSESRAKHAWEGGLQRTTLWVGVSSPAPGPLSTFVSGYHQVTRVSACAECNVVLERLLGV